MGFYKSRGLLPQGAQIQLDEGERLRGQVVSIGETRAAQGQRLHIGRREVSKLINDLVKKYTRTT